MDCSRPLNTSANAYMDLEHYKYVTVDHAADQAQPGCWLAKVDLKHAYRSVGTHPDSWRVTGMSWCFKGYCNPTFLFDKRLPFGARISPMIFHRLTQSVCRMMAHRGYTVLAYLDDFLIIETSQHRCQAAFDILITLLESLGFTINWTKAVRPTQTLTFLGVVIDTAKRELRPPEDRVAELVTLLQETLSKRKCSKLHLLHQARADLQWWASLLLAHNCKALFPEDIPQLTSPVFTDASVAGGGCVWQSDWLYVNWALDYPDLCPLHINYKETFSILLAAFRWAPFWIGHRVCIKSDSQVAAAIINKGSTPCTIIMDQVRTLFWLKESYNFSLSVEHIPGISNSLADSFSRLDEVQHLSKFQVWLSQSSAHYQLESHMSPSSLALVRFTGSMATGL